MAPLLTTLCLLLFLVAEPALAQGSRAPPNVSSDDEALALSLVALNHQDYKTALELLRPLARKGNRIAQHNIGVMLATGRGLPQDHGSARGFFRMAASPPYVFDPGV